MDPQGTRRNRLATKDGYPRIFHPPYPGSQWTTGGRQSQNGSHEHTPTRGQRMGTLRYPTRYTQDHNGPLGSTNSRGRSTRPPGKQRMGTLRYPTRHTLDHNGPQGGAYFSLVSLNLTATSHETRARAGFFHKLRGVRNLNA